LLPARETEHPGASPKVDTPGRARQATLGDHRVSTALPVDMPPLEHAPALALLALHGLFWTGMSIARLHAWRRRAGTRSAAMPAAPAEARVARGSRLLVVLHGLGFAVLYAALGRALPHLSAALDGDVAAPFDVRPVAGGAAIVLGGVVAVRAMAVLRSWRLRAALRVDHELTTEGVFAWVRHPIYLALDLLAIGSAIWCPTAGTAIGAALVVLGGDLRARAEEALLVATYGDVYRAYAARTARLVPGLY
jgi:protein-S-isoprenylcysteine O-methyltransferase Ste14